MCTLNLREQVTDADSDPCDPRLQTEDHMCFTPLKTDKRVNGHRHTHSLYMRCDDHIINYSSKKQQKYSLLVCKAQMGQWPHFQGTDFMHVQSHTRFLLREKLKEDVPLLFFHLSAHIKQRYPSHPLPPPHSTPSEPAAAASSATANHRKAWEQRKAWCSATFQESTETLPRFSLHQCWWQMKKAEVTDPPCSHTYPSPLCALNYIQVHSTLYVRITVM